uniref:diacylglycerol O-acyltransferase n=1 Tax=Oreochromis aureus TaxID=47969 RepID=A0A668SAN4_OREAU
MKASYKLQENLTEPIRPGCHCAEITVQEDNENVFLCSCHSIQDSLLSSNSSFTGYRGILNWIIILLVSFSALPSHLTSMCTSHCLKSTFMLCPPGGAFFSLLFYTILGMKLYSRTTIRMDLHHRNTTMKLYYFLLAPTLCFQRGFPCSPKVRINKLLHRLLEMVVVVQIMVGIVQQVQQITEVLSLLYSSLVSLLLCAPTHFLWLLFFFLTHSYLNFCAELLRFGDRHFYGDWWNATTLIAFWKNWNIPFQRWCHRYYQHFLVCVLECLTWGFFAYMFFFLCIKRHIYTRLVERNVSPSHAEFCRLWIFLMMLLVAVFLQNYFQGNYGNGLVWLFLLLGPPLAVTTYFHDHYVSLHINRQHRPSQSPLTSERRVFLQLH